MQTLPIFVVRQEARAGALFLGALSSLLFVGSLVLALTDQIDWGPPVIWVLGGLVYFWLFGVLGAWTLRLWRLGKFDGPLLVIRQNGIEDNWTRPPRILRWADIQYSEWRRAQFTRSLRIVAKQQSLFKWVLATLGLGELDFPEQYLSEPADEIAQFMSDHAPPEILR